MQTKIVKLVMKALKEYPLTKEQWVEFGEFLDGDRDHDFLEAVNEHLEKIAPEIFVEPEPTKMRKL